MRLFVAGDWHGNTKWALAQVQRCAELGISNIVHLGDFGIWQGAKGEEFLRELSAELIRRNVTLRFVDGNHENFPLLYSYPLHENGMRLVAGNIWHMPRGYVWEAGGKRMAAIGGAVSIDRHYRIPGHSWWPEEMLTLADEENVLAAETADIIFSHDCPENVPMSGLIPDRLSAWHRGIITKLASRLNPKLWLHGHMHMPLHYWFGDIEVVGLDCDGRPHSFCVLDLSDGTVEFLTDPGDNVFRQSSERWHSNKE